jgi:hypothetical protein
MSTAAISLFSLIPYLDYIDGISLRPQIATLKMLKPEVTDGDFKVFITSTENIVLCASLMRK